MKERRAVSISLVILVIALAIIFISQTNAQGEWSYQRTITIDPDQVSGDGDLLNFPVLVSLTGAWLKDTANGGHVAQDDGGDILFTTTDHTKLNHEIEKYDRMNGTLVAWVQIPTLSSDSDTTIYMLYGNANCEDQWNPDGVWDANYRMVQHLEETSGTHYDSTSNSNDCTPQGGVTQDAVGQIDGADNFDGYDDAVNCGVGGQIESWSNQDQGQQRAVIKDGKIYVVGGGDDSVPTFNAYVFVFDLATGQLLQQSPSLGDWFDFTASETAPVVAVDAVSGHDMVYATPTKSNISAWDMNTDTILWTATGLSIWSNRLEFDGFYLYATTTDYRVVKVDVSNGSVVDSFDLEDHDTDNENAVPPYLDQFNGTLFAMSANKLYKLSASTLSEDWNRDIGTGCLDTGGGHSRMAPIVVKDAYTGNEPWVIFGCWGTDYFYAYDYAGNQKWSKYISEGVRAVASYDPNNGYLFIPSQGDKIYALNVTTGAQQFAITTPLPGGGTGFDSPCTIANDFLLFKTTSGSTRSIYVYNANNGEYITRFSLGSNPYLTCFPVAASQGYLVTGGSLVNIGGSDGGIFAVKAGEGEAVDYYPLYGPDKYGYVDNALTSLNLQKSLNPTSEITLEAWANLNDLTSGTNDHLVCRENTYCLKFAQTGQDVPRFQLWPQGQSRKDLDLSIQLNIGEWYYLAGTWDGTVMQLYVNGGILSDPLDFVGTMASTTNPTFIGSYTGVAPQAPDGWIDEVRISDTARSADWIQTCYNNQSSPATFYSVGEEGVPTAVTVAAFAATPGVGAVNLTWETASEIDSLGFNLYRSEASDGPFARLNSSLIPSQADPGTLTGAVYHWSDGDVLPGATYYYKLEHIDIYGRSTPYGPVQVTMRAAPVRLLYLPLVLKSRP